jgi:hypothetical protein
VRKQLLDLAVLLRWQPGENVLHVGIRIVPIDLGALPMSLGELMGHAVTPVKRGTKLGPTSRLHQQIDAVEQLPKAKQQFVSEMLDTVLAQGAQ